MPSSANVIAWNPSQNSAASSNARRLRNSVTGDSSSAVNEMYCSTTSSAGYCSSCVETGFGRRMIAHARIALFGQPNVHWCARIFAIDDRKYVAIVATWMHRNAQPAASVLAVERNGARPTVGSTSIAMRIARWSWSTFP